MALVLWAAWCSPLHADEDGEGGGGVDEGPSSVRINEKMVHYAIVADSIDELRERLREQVPPASAHGHTSSDVGIAYEFETSTAGCRLHRLEVRLDIVVTLPEWKPPRAVPDAQWQHWEQALAALQRHEAFHRGNARAAAEQARVRILGIGVQPDCRTLRNTASRLLRRTMLKYEFRDRRYDARTGSGATEGAVL